MLGILKTTKRGAIGVQIFNNVNSSFLFYQLDGMEDLWCLIILCVRVLGDGQHWDGCLWQYSLLWRIYPISGQLNTWLSFLKANRLLDLAVSIYLELGVRAEIEIHLDAPIVFLWRHLSRIYCRFSIFQALDWEILTFSVAIDIGLLGTVVSNVGIGLLNLLQLSVIARTVSILDAVTIVLSWLAWWSDLCLGRCHF